jgi:Ca-activated chloride channel family protein
LYPLEGGGFAKLHIDNDPETLRKVAQISGGEALAADDPAGLSRSLAGIDKLEKTALPVDPPTEGEPMIAPLLALAAILALPLAIDLFRKRGRKIPAWLEGR